MVSTQADAELLQVRDELHDLIDNGDLQNVVNLLQASGGQRS